MINLFNFATSELSQDAVLCWLLSWSDQEKSLQNDNEELRKISNNLILLFLHQHDKYKNISADDIEYLQNLKQQYHKTDVYFQVKLTKYDKSISVIIEDKTNTSHHNDQLNIYIQKISKDKIEEHDVIGIYFKTGFINNLDKQLPEQYKLVTNTMFNDFLNEQVCANEIFKEYKSYFNAYQLKFDKPIMQATSDTDFYEGLKSVQGQDALIQLIRNGIENTSVNYGTNTGGTPWSHLKFCKFKPETEVNTAKLHQFHESFFVRIDYRLGADKKGMPYIAFRNYCRYDKNENNNLLRVKRLHFYKEIFKNCWNQIINDSNSEITLGRPVGDNSGNYEQEIATLFLNGTNNTPSSVVPIVRSAIIAFEKELQLRFKEFRLLDEVQEPLLARLKNHFQSDSLNITPYYHKNKNEHLCELKFSLKPWITKLGEEGVIVMLYQYKTTEGFAIRTFCKTDNLSQSKLLNRHSKTSNELNIKPIKKWTTWSTLYKEASYPKNAYHMDFCADSLASKVIGAIELADKHLSNVMDS